MKLPARTVKVAVKLPGMSDSVTMWETKKPKADRPSGSNGNGKNAKGKNGKGNKDKKNKGKKGKSTDRDDDGESGTNFGDGSDQSTEDFEEARKAKWTCQRPGYAPIESDALWEFELYAAHCVVEEATIGGAPLFVPGDGYRDSTPYTVSGYDCFQPTQSTLECWMDVTFTTHEWKRFNRQNVTINGVPVTTQQSVTTRVSFVPESYTSTASGWSADVRIPDGTEIGSFVADPVGNRYRPPHWEATSLGLPAGSRIPVYWHNGIVDYKAFWAGTSLAHQLGGYVLPKPYKGTASS